MTAYQKYRDENAKNSAGEPWTYAVKIGSFQLVLLLLFLIKRKRSCFHISTIYIYICMLILNSSVLK